MADPFIISAIFLLAGFVQGMSGFGSALVAIPLLSFVMEIKTAVPLCMLNSLVITIFLALQMKKHLDRKKIMPFCLAALPGILVGATILKKVASSAIQISMGFLLCFYSIYSLFAKPHPRYLHPIWPYLAGFSSGAIGAAFSAGGPPTIIYTSLTNWSKDTIKATLTGFFLFNSCLTVIVHVLSGLSTIEVFSFFLFTAPVTLLGTVLGSISYGRLQQESYFRLIFTFLIVMGIIMIITSY